MTAMRSVEWMARPRVLSLVEQMDHYWAAQTVALRDVTKAAVSDYHLALMTVGSMAHLWVAKTAHKWEVHSADKMARP